MAALPKKKHSKSRTRIRKSKVTLKLPTLTTCPKCQSPKLPHRACPACGFYKT